MALFLVLSTYVAVILLLIAAGPLWAWIQLWRRRLPPAARMNAPRKRQNLTIIKL
jgi:hypothetical protein